MAYRLPNPVNQFVDANGNPLVSGSLEFYTTGTSTPKNVYADSGLVTSLGNTLSLDSKGRTTSDFWMDGSYRVIAKNAAGGTEWTRDEVNAAGGSASGIDTLRADLASNASGKGSSLVGFDGTLRTVTEKLRDLARSPADEGGAPGGVVDCSAAFAAITTKINAAGFGAVYLPEGLWRVQAAANTPIMGFQNLSGLYIYGPGKLVADPISSAWASGTSASAVGTTVTINHTAHGKQVNDEIVVRGLTPSQANGFQIINSVTANSFTYITATAPGAITGTPQYTAADYFRSVIKVSNCNKVVIDTNILGETLPVDQMYRLGYRGVYLTGTNQDADIRVRGSGLSYGVVQGDALKNARIVVTGDDMGYPISVQGINDFHLWSAVDTVHRAVYCADPQDGEIFSHCANFDASGVLVTATLNRDVKNIRIVAPAAAQTAALTLHRATAAPAAYVNAQSAVTARYQNIDIWTSLRATETEGLTRYPVEVDLSLVTGRADGIRINTTFDRKDQTTAANHQREIIFRTPAGCPVAGVEIVSTCRDPDSVDSTLTSGFVLDVANVDGDFIVDRRGGKSGYSINASSTDKIQWRNPFKSKPGRGGVKTPGTTGNSVVWPSSRIDLGDFTLHAKLNDVLATTGIRTLCMAGTSSTGRTARGLHVDIDNTAGDMSVYLYGATLADFNKRFYSTIGRFGRGGLFDLFVIRRSGVLELWIDGIQLNGVASTSGTPPGEGGDFDSDFVFFSGNSNTSWKDTIAATGFFSKALSRAEMDVVSRGGALADTSLVIHQSDYAGARRNTALSYYGTRKATIASGVTVLDIGGVLETSAVIDFPSIAGGAVSTQTATVTGAIVGDAVVASPRNALAAGIVQASPGRVSAPDTVSIDLFNTTAGAIDPASNTWDIRVTR